MILILKKKKLKEIIFSNTQFKQHLKILDFLRIEFNNFKSYMLDFGDLKVLLKNTKNKLNELEKNDDIFIVYFEDLDKFLERIIQILNLFNNQTKNINIQDLYNNLRELVGVFLENVLKLELLYYDIKNLKSRNKVEML